MIVLIIILSILLGIPLLVFLLLLFPVAFDARYDSEGVYLSIRYLFIKKVILSKTEDAVDVQELEEKAQEETEKEESKIMALLKKKGLKNLLSLLKELLKLAFGTLKKIVKKIKIKYLLVNVDVSTDNAADTAIRYGQACAVVYPFVSGFASIAKCKKSSANVSLDYKREHDIIDVKIKGSIRPIFVVIHGFGLVIKALPYIKQLRA